MSQLLTSARQTWLYWRLFLMRCTLFSISQLCIVWQTSTANVNIDSLGKWERLGLFAGMFAVWAGTILALLDQTLGRIAKGKLPTETDSDPPFKP